MIKSTCDKFQTEELKKKNSLLDSIVRSATDGLLVIDMHGKVEFFSDQFQKLWRIPKRIIKTKDDKKLLDFVLNQLLNPKEFLEKVNYLYRHPKKESFDTIKFKDGRIFERYSVPQKSGKHILGRVWSFRDVTKSKELERAKTEFLSLASHQLRTPLAGTKWIIELFMQDKELTEKNKERLKDLYISNERMINLVNMLLNVTKIESGKLLINKQEVNIEEIINDSCNLYKPNVDRKNQQIKISNNTSINKAYLDPTLFQEAFNNILSNSINYGPENSIIDVKIVLDKNNYIISIHNFGLAIPKEEHKNLFDKFYRGSGAKNIKSEGSGLGLFISKKVIEANGGKIWFDSDNKIGTTFYFTIPKK